MTEAWVLGMVLNAVVGAAFLTIGLSMATRVTLTNQWRRNHVAGIFSLLVVACGAGHGLRAGLLAAPSLGIDLLAAEAARVEFADWHMWVADLATALAGVFYVAARVRGEGLLATARAFQDFRTRRNRALEVHDGAVQNLAAAKLALESGQQEVAKDRLRDCLETSRGYLTDVHPDLDGESGGQLGADAADARGEGSS